MVTGAKVCRLTVEGVEYDLLVQPPDCGGITHKHLVPHLDGTAGEEAHHHHSDACGRRPALLVPTHPTHPPFDRSRDHALGTAVKLLGRKTKAAEVERILGTLTDGSFEVIAVEVFDAPDSTRARVDGVERDVGPWVLGRRADVEAYLAFRGFEDFEVQYSECSSPEQGEVQ